MAMVKEGLHLGSGEDARFLLLACRRGGVWGDVGAVVRVRVCVV